MVLWRSCWTPGRVFFGSVKQSLDSSQPKLRLSTKQAHERTPTMLALTQKVPFSICNGVLGFVGGEAQVEFQPVIQPRLEDESACLIVEREPRDVYGTRQWKPARWKPLASTVSEHAHVRFDVRIELRLHVFVSATNNMYEWLLMNTTVRRIGNANILRSLVGPPIVHVKTVILRLHYCLFVYILFDYMYVLPRNGEIKLYVWPHGNTQYLTLVRLFPHADDPLPSIL